eukprot:CAMPEP_0173075638 /NCGR_PEP_ID=MMETSP1102-20130122/11805_1 /TAXON_ID=49646 /ORGANISM="Geminigera sp., Strain Caron Lab Isolate" /LENGTH=98 /DNA_ID=CAMNT_0013945083 /DNA_START=918 /DNA_END=1214 /DNA_ORIENTATION=+
MHLGVYPLALEKELARHIHLVALFIDSAHAVLGVCYTRMVLSVHPDVDLEAFLELIERLFISALYPVDYSDIVVRFSHVWMFTAKYPDADLKAFLVLN